MALYYLAGFDTNDIGTMSVVVGGAVGSGTATVTAGTYCHRSITNVSATSTYSDFATEVDDALTSVAGAWTVTYNATTHAYTIEAGGTAFTLTWTGTGGTNLRRALGFSGNVGSTTSATSDVRPYYVMVPAIAGRSEFTDVYEPDEDVVEEATADDDTPFAIAKERGAIASQIMWNDWVQSMETKAATLASAAASSAPWTWQHFFQHCRGKEPFLVVDGSSETVHKLRAQGAAFNATVRSRVATDYDGLWNLRLFTRQFVGSP
jgi:hypothetical protein